ncbi:DUF4013 domain-containing protein [Halopiger djelfimassiliensis]|uniref:DUF4013 domain-containing protein n=1 Tax=Halopiger djelfimassiliensis TaxID=1293047 RepID=UPI000677D766|nr:DUF4013 domain-containing protein [Halopiger djelfimassiliensis]
MSYCSECDETFERGTLICPTCGGKLGDDRSDTSDPSHRQADPIPTASASDEGSTSGGDRDLFDVAFRFPLGRSGRPLLIDSVLIFLGFLVVPLLCSYGYSFRLGRAAARGDPEPPSFEDWGGLGTDGLVLFAVYLAWTVALVGVMGVAVLGAVPIEDPVGVLLIVAAGVFIALALGYVGGAIVPVLIGTGSLKESIADWRFVRFAFSIHYLKGILLLVAFSSIAGIAMSIVAFVLVITVFGALLLFPLYYVFTAYLTNMAFAVWGHIYAEAAEAGDVPPVDPDGGLGIE